MTKPKLCAMMKRIRKMIRSEEGVEVYDIPEKLSYGLLDLGYIEFVRECMGTRMGIVTTSYFRTTRKGRDAYHEWKTKNIPEIEVKNDQ